MALMEMVTRRGTFLDLGQMGQTEFCTWWSSMLREGVKCGCMLLDVYECETEADATAVAYAETVRGTLDAAQWWERETDGECDLRLFCWIDAEHRFLSAYEGDAEHRFLSADEGGAAL